MKKAERANLPKRDNFASQFGLIMASVGSAVGLGNIWRFSYILGENGGGAFLIIYILCVVLVGAPLMITEITLGRKTHLSTVSAFKKLSPGSYWWITGMFAVLAPTIIMAYYPVIAGWSLGYMFESLASWNEMKSDTEAFFNSFISSDWVFVFSIFTLILTAVILYFGISKGIEKTNKVLMPSLAIILIILVIRSCTLPGAVEGIKFLFVPDFTKLSVTGVLDALGHSFFSLSLGMGIMITYGSYMSKKADLPGAAVSILTIDTVVALLAGLAIFPSVFAFGFDPGQGAGLAFITLPAAFAKMPGGQFFSALFFLLIFIAALTSIMSLVQVPLAWMEDELKISKKKGLIIITVVLIIAGIPSVLSFSSLADFKILGNTYFDFLDKISNNILLPVTGLLTTLFVIFRWGVANAKKEFTIGSKNEKSLLVRIYPFAIKYIAPIAIAVILVYSIYTSFIKQ